MADGSTIAPCRATAAVLFMVAVLIGSAGLMDVARASPVGKVSALTGRATIARATSAPSAAALNAALYLRDIIHTLRASVMSLLFVDNTIVKVSQNTRLTINTYMFDPNKKTRRSVLGLVTGAIKFSTSRLMGFKDKRFEVVTHTAVIGARGTTVAVEALSGGAAAGARLSVVYNASRDGSLVEVGLGSAPARKVVLDPGEIVRVFADRFGPVTKATPAETGRYEKIFQSAPPASSGWKSFEGSGGGGCSGE